MKPRSRFLVTGLALTLALTGCDSSPTPSSSTKVSAKVDPITGVIRLPLDEYNLTLAEDGVHLTANELALSRCMKKSGYPEFFPFVDRRNPGPEADRRYGVWVRAEVARYGYQIPPPSNRGKLLQKYNKIKFTPAADTALQACIKVSDRLGLRLPETGDDLSGGSDPGSAHIEDSAPWKAVHEEWVSCLKDHHAATPSRGRWIADEVMEGPLETQIRIGLIDVGCKEKLNVVKRLSDMQANAQQPYIEKHEAALVAQRRRMDALVKRSRDYLAGAAELQTP